LSLNPILFHVVSDISKASNKKSPCFLLVKSTWDDYGFKSTFTMSYKYPNGEIALIGLLKIIKMGIESGSAPIDNSFPSLSPDYCSLGSSIQFYEKLIEIIGLNKSYNILKKLKDCGISKRKRDLFEEHPGYIHSLLRSGQDDETFTAIEGLFNESLNVDDGFSFIFGTQISDNSEHILGFDFEPSDYLPYRINVIVGKNGTGKTTFLANLARVYTGLDYPPVGAFLSDKPLFRQVIAVSYNPFDDFYIPANSGAEKGITSKSDGFFFGYKYLGLRKRLGHETYSLKTLRELELEFRRALDRVVNMELQSQLWEIFEPVLRDSSFRKILQTDDMLDLRSNFKNFSSGQKFVLLALIRLFLNTRKKSLVLLDEPENHLHPTILTRFMQSFNLLLEKRNSFAIISTHSPFIIQETPSRYVSILSRVSDRPEVSQLKNESFGGSLNEIVEDVFKLTVEDSSFEKTIKRIYKARIPVEDITKILQMEPNMRIRSISRKKNEID
jgi:predicted ATPase